MGKKTCKAQHTRLQHGHIQKAIISAHHKATAMAQEHPTAAAMASFIGCRLRSLKPSKPSNSSKSLPTSAKKRHPTAAAMASFIGVQGCQPRRHKLPQGQIHRFFSARSMPTGTPRPQQWLLRLLMGVQACRLPALKPLKPLKRLKPLKPLKLLKLCHSVWDAQSRSLKPLKLCPSVWDAQPRRHKLPQGQIHRFFSARSMPTCRLPAFKPQGHETLPQRLGRPTAQLKTVKTLSKRWDAQPRRHKLPQGQIHRFFSARSMPTGTPRPQQWLLRLLMGVQACRLPALKPLKPLKPLKRLKPLKPLKLLKLCHSVWDAQPRSFKPLKLCPSVWDAQPRRHKLPQGQIHRFFSARSMPTGTPRPQQWRLRLLMGVQACRLPALKPLKPLKRLKPLKPLKLLKLCHSVWDAQSRSLKPFKTLSKRLGCPTAQA